MRSTKVQTKIGTYHAPTKPERNRTDVVQIKYGHSSR